MKSVPFTRPLRSAVAISVLAVAGLATAQSSNATKVASQPNPDDAFLAKAGTLYYSTAKTGLAGFDCDIVPDWHTLFESASPGTTIAADDSRIVLLQKVQATLHARMKGGSTLDWKPEAQDKPLDADSTQLLQNMHSATDQTLQGFLQFWTPFVDGSVIPANSEGLDITNSATGHTLHAKTEDSEVTEVLDNNLVLQHFDVELKSQGESVKFDPSFQSTEKGLLVDSFHAVLRPLSDPPEKAQQMNVHIDYKTIDGNSIPSRVSMVVVGNGTFNFTFTGCKVNLDQK